MLDQGVPAAVIWDMAGTDPEDWQLMRRLQNHPQLHQIPFVLYQQNASTEEGAVLTSLVVKPAQHRGAVDSDSAYCTVSRDGVGINCG